MKRLGFALSAALACSTLASQTPPADLTPKACRPLFTTSAGLTDPGFAELELGAQTIHNRDGSKDRFVPTQLNVGIDSWFDLRVGWSGPALRKDSQGEQKAGGSDPVIGGQALFLSQARGGVDLGLAHWHKIPRASVAKGIGTGRHDDTLLLTASRTQGRWAFDLNAGANWIGRKGGGGRVRQAALSLAITCAVAPAWNLTLDTYALAATKLGPQALSSVLAVRRDLTPRLCVDLGVEAGHTDGAPRLSLNAGLVWRMGRIF
ncbi:transporter [Mesoterricola silvestris]|uniref:Uncharacterized protein n=1 Tax=Mesoterricola silvestris TaxID=2927979 RepID=A0AA48KBN7_9BACT|nr:transporter [Mesoterricola silvestris]BDU74512.1 hypothetical protein METEAL_36860 [Mesoterricola silvestris]